MSSSTVYSCDSCGTTINEENDMAGEEMAEVVLSSSTVKNGERYVANNATVEREEWDLCIPCGKRVIKAMREALSG